MTPTKREPSFLLLGGAGKDPRLCSIYPNDNEGEHQWATAENEIDARSSLYGLSLSPGHRWLAAGSRPKVGSRGQIITPSMVTVYRLEELWLQGLPEPALHISIQPGLCDLDITDKGEIAVACCDGTIRFYSENSSASTTGVLPAHQGTVFAVASVGGDLLSSFGVDGVFKLWDVPKRACLYRAPACVPPTSGALMQFAVSHKHRRVYFGCGKGHLHAYDLDKSRMDIIQAHSGDATAVAWDSAGDRIITGGAHDGAICIWSADDLSLVSRKQHDKPILGLVVVSEHQTASIDDAGQVALWTTNGAIEKGAILTEFRARSWAGPNIESFREHKRVETIRLKDELVSGALRNIEAHDYDSARDQIDRLCELGCGSEAALLHAQWFDKQGRLLEELSVFLRIAEQTGPALLGSESRYAYATLCMKLGEPEMAREAFLSADAYRDAEDRASRAEDHPLFGLTPASTVRADLSEPDDVLQEAKKCSILRKHFPWTVPIFPICSGLISTPLDLSMLRKTLAEREIGRIDLQDVKIVGKDNRKRKTDLLKIQIEDPFFDGVKYAIAQEQIGTSWRTVSYVLLSPVEDFDLHSGFSEWNDWVVERIKSLQENDALKQWVQRIHKCMIQDVVEMTNVNFAADGKVRHESTRTDQVMSVR